MMQGWFGFEEEVRNADTEGMDSIYLNLDETGDVGTLCFQDNNIEGLCAETCFL